MPYTMEINDGPVLRSTGDTDYFARICKSQFDQLYREGAKSGRVMCIAIHPCWTGQPHRIRWLDEALSYILGHEGVWLTTAGEIADYYYTHCYERMVTHVAALNAA